MEFKFNVNKLLPNKINKVTHTLIPKGFRGNRAELIEHLRQLTKILDDMGKASARAQGLIKPITSADKLGDTDHIIYLLVDSQGNKGQGVVVGLLKSGSKNLFMFDEAGMSYQLKPRCVLDFYVHESRQRMGLGNLLYQHMLADEGVKPTKLAIDRPSEKFLAFLRKYYGLSCIIPQNNNFVVFRGFFDDEVASTRDGKQVPREENSANNKFWNLDRDHVGANRTLSADCSGSRATTVPIATSNPYGRYAATRPPCSMADIIHNTTVLGQPVERSGDSDVGNEVTWAKVGWTSVERPRSLSLYSEEEHKRRMSELPTVSTPMILDDQQPPSLIGLSDEVVEECHDGGTTTHFSSTLCAPRLMTPSMGVKSSPSCAQQQQVTTVKNVDHVDLKFYHSPLW